jgi:hypothetical protein
VNIIAAWLLGMLLTVALFTVLTAIEDHIGMWLADLGSDDDE